MNMNINRRNLLLGSAAVSLATAMPRGVLAAASFAPKPGKWRTFELTTRIEIEKPGSRAQAWIPLPSVNEADWFRSGKSASTGNAANAVIRRDPVYGAAMLHAEWKGGAKGSAVIEVASRFAVQDRAADLSGPGSAAPLSAANRLLYTGATDLIPIDGLVKRTADEITAGAQGDLEKARRIYDWIVENCFRDPATKGCGDGDVARMLATSNLGGKCADLNGLYIGLARAAGLPARDVYGLRVAPSAFGYKSLGAGSADVTKAQHCRAEVHIAGHGWIAVDPADVRKVMLQEAPGNLALNHPKVAAARDALFGAWEGNWAAYNFAHDVALPGAEGGKLGFFMYPQAEIAGRRLDCLDPEAFRYTITAREIIAG